MRVRKVSFVMLRRWLLESQSPKDRGWLPRKPITWWESMEIHYSVHIPGLFPLFPCPQPSPLAMLISGSQTSQMTLSSICLMVAASESCSLWEQKEAWGRGAVMGRWKEHSFDPRIITSEVRRPRENGLPSGLQEVSNSWGEAGTSLSVLEWEEVPPRLSTCLCFHHFSSFLGVSSKVL